MSCLSRSTIVCARHLCDLPHGPSCVRCRHAASASLTLVRRVGRWTPDAAAFAQFVRRTYGRIAHEAGLASRKDEDDDRRLLRRDLLRVLAREGNDATTAAERLRRASLWLHDPAAIEPDLRETIVGVAVRFGDDAFLHRVIAALRTTDDRQTLIHAIGWTRTPAAVLALTLDPSTAPTEALELLIALGDDAASRPDTLHFIRDHYAALAARLPNDMFFPSVIDLPYVAATGCEEESRAFVEELLAARTGRIAGGAPIVNEMGETIRACQAARARQGPDLRYFLRATRPAPRE
jgi:hypothetical protein